MCVIEREDYNIYEYNHPLYTLIELQNTQHCSRPYSCALNCYVCMYLCIDNTQSTIHNNDGVALWWKGHDAPQTCFIENQRSCIVKGCMVLTGVPFVVLRWKRKIQELTQGVYFQTASIRFYMVYSSGSLYAFFTISVLYLPVKFIRIDQ